jgi:ABC-type multidrug transport system fused ATPase/permease subunit
VKSLSSTKPQIFRLEAGKVSVGLARDRLWQVKEGKAKLRVLVGGNEVGTMPVTEFGWFLVPESDFLRVQLIAETPIAFESRLPLSLIPRLGDLGRNQLIQPIRQMMFAAGIDDGLVDWSVKLAQPTFRSWFGDSLDQAIKLNQPMSPDFAAPLIADHVPRTILEQESISEERRALTVLLLVSVLSILAVVSWLSVLVALEAPGFSLSYHYSAIALGASGMIALTIWIIHLLAQQFRDVLPVGLAAALAMITLILLFEAPMLAISLIFSSCLIGGAYWVYVLRLLPDLPAIDQPMRWLSRRLSRDGVPSVRERVLEVWDQARQWVVARIELVAEYSRFSRSVIAASLVIPAIASTDDTRPIVLTGLSLGALLLLERLRAAMPVSLEMPLEQGDRRTVRPLALSGEVQYEGVVFRRHAGEAPLFDQMNFHCPDDSLVRITAAEGAGLSTLKHLLLRQVAPERGVVRIGGMDVARIDPQVLAHSVIMLDHPRDSEVSTVGEWLFIEPGIEPSTLEMHLQALSASHWIELLHKRLNASLGALQSMAGPHGMNRLKLARALSRKGQLMWLDHWLMGLNQSSRAHVIHRLVERSGTRFVVDRNELLKGQVSIHWEIERD